MKKNSIIAAAVLTLALAGCDGGKPAEPSPPPSVSPSQTPAVTQAPKKQEKKIEKTDKDTVPSAWTTLGEQEYDVISDGNADIISLRTSAVREDGELLLDDSQEWALTVKTEDGIYPLYRERTHGTPYMDISELYIGEETVPVITLYVFASAGTEIRQYRYRDGAFYESTIYSTQEEADGGINRIYSNIPKYE